MKPEKSVIAIEIYGGRIKLCEAGFSGKRNPVFRFVSEEIPAEASGISAHLADLFATRSFTAKKILLNIPRHQVMARFYHLPSINDEEIKNMVRMEAVKHVPYRDEDIITGHRVIERFKDGYSDVLVAMAQAETVKGLLRILQGAGLRAEKVALGSESLFLWYLAVMRRTKKAAGIALISIDSGYVNMDIIVKQAIVFARAFSYDPNAPEAMRKAAEEISKSVAIYRKDKNIKIEKMLVSGAEARLREIGPILKEDAASEAEIVPQTEAVELAEKAEKALSESSFPELIGLALKKEEAAIDLLPEDVKENKEFIVFKKAARRTLVLLGFALLAALCVIGQKIFDKSRLLRILNREIKAMAPRVASAKRMKGDLKIIKGEIQKKPLAIDVLSELYKITPAGMTFNLVDYESGQALLLRGSASSLDGVIRFITIIENAEYFESAKLKYTAKRTRRGKEAIDFEIVCKIWPGKI